MSKKKNKDERPTVTPAETRCIHRRNPNGGFHDQHRATCALDKSHIANCHISHGHWCGNVCTACAEKPNHKPAQFCPEPLLDNTLPLEAVA